MIFSVHRLLCIPSPLQYNAGCADCSFVVAAVSWYPLVIDTLQVFSTAHLSLLQCPVVLRLVFHDSGTYNIAAGNGGANASIQHELERPENFGLKRGWKVIQQAMSSIQGTAADGLVSNADMIALVGAYAVGLCGGPLISVPVG